jgi:hypothetical protein
MTQNDNNKEYAPIWVGVLGLFLLLGAPLEDQDFFRNFLCYICINVPLALFCVYASGGFRELFNRINNK